MRAADLTICHLADVHLGYRRYNRVTKSGHNQREMDVNAAFRECIDRILQLRPALVIIAGDLFHHVRPTNAVLSFGFRQIKRLAQVGKIPVVIVAGNHEYPKRADTGCALELLSEIENVFIADRRIEKFQFPEIDFCVTCLPQPALAGIDKGEIRADDNFKFNVLALHAQLSKQTISDFGGVEVDLSLLSPHEWDYIALGHLHEMQEVGLNATYSGSLEHTGTNIWSGADRRKGFLEISFPGAKKTFHSLSSPREILDLPEIDATALEAPDVDSLIEESLENVPGGIQGKIVRLPVINIPLRVMAGLNYKKIREYKSRALSLIVEFRQTASANQNAGVKLAPPRTLIEELSAFCETSEPGDFPADEVKKLLLSYLERTDQKNEASKFEP